MSLPPLDIPALLRSQGLHTSKRLGQNFLTDEHALQKIVATADINPTDVVLEIGAGLGNLTRLLALHAAQVVAVEIDERLLNLLEQTAGAFNNVHIIHGDILALDISKLFELIPLPDQSYLVVANIPYYITSALIRYLLESPIRPSRVVLTIQREVAQRICAEPGDYSLLALSVQVYGQPIITARIPAGAFYPPPQVDSAIVRIKMYPQPVIDPKLLDTFFHLIRAGFSQKRKTLRNALRAGLSLPSEIIQSLLSSAGIDYNRRAETLTLAEWETLSRIYSNQVKS